MSMFAALLDRSFAEIGELAADGRFFDREKVARIADVWDNNTFPLFGVALCPFWAREQRARAALEWMAEFAPSRCAWMTGQTAAGPDPAEAAHHRDYRGDVQPGRATLTAAVLADIATDYDLDRAEMRTVRVERAGRRLDGHVALVAPRRYARPPDYRDAVVHLLLSDVRDARFDSGDAADPSLTVDANGIEVRCGVRGRLHAVSATVDFDDPSWHLSHAGRVADANTPRRDATRRQARKTTRPAPRGAAFEAAAVVRAAMLLIRSVRYAKVVGRVPLPELCAAFAGAGQQVLAAAGRPRWARDRQFLRLAEHWIGGSPHLARNLTRFGLDHLVPAGSGRDVQPPEEAGPPDRAQLTLFGYSTSSAVLNLAVPEPDGTWGLRSMEFSGPAHLTVDTTAFTAPRPFSRADGGPVSLGAAMVLTPAS